VTGTADAVERAAAFLQEQGDPLARAAAAALAGRGSVADALATLPQPDSLAEPGDLAPLLGVCADLRALHPSFVQSAAACLAGAQAPDGGFAGSDLPRRIATSGMLGGYLARSPYVRPRTLDAVGEFLSTHWSPDLVQSGVWANVAGYAHYFANAPHEAADEILQWCGRELERGFRARTFRAVETLRVLGLCDAHAIPGATLTRDELGVALLTEQAPDGSFGAPGSSLAMRLEDTRAGLVALLRFAPASS
jgi:hypothetical protein